VGWRQNKQKGSALPVVLALGLGVTALASAYALRTTRERGREQMHRYSTEALYTAFAQMEVVSSMINASPYDGTGANACLQSALISSGQQFIDRDGWPTGVTITEVGGAGSGLFELWSSATVRGQTRKVSALVRERQSFADFNYFVSSQSLGIAGGEVGAFPYPDAPEGSIHTNDQLVFYFPDRHFRDAVTAVNGFDYTAGAVGTSDPGGTNTHLHGPSNDSADAITGLVDVDPASFAGRPDNLLSIAGDPALTYAKVWLQETQVVVEHWQKGFLQVGDPVPTWIDDYNYGAPYDVQVADYGWVDQSVWTLVTPAYTQSAPDWRWGPWYQVWIAGGGGDATSGDGGSGGVGYWEWTRDWVYSTVTIRDYANDVYAYVDTPVWTDLGTTHTESRQDRIAPFGHYEDQPSQTWISEHMVASHTVGSSGTIYVEGDVFLEPSHAGTHGNDVHVLDGSLTIASADDILIRDSIVYGKRDGSNVLQTAYLNGNDKDLPYIPNTDYTGSSVLGLLAADRIEYQSHMPSQSEVNATMLAKSAQVAVDGVSVASDGTVSPQSSGAFVKQSLRRLGGIVSNKRPVSSYVDSNNAVTRGFVHGKSVFDVRQRVAPPRGFPTLNRPRMLAMVLREVQ
jgi:hypothetical protein